MYFEAHILCILFGNNRSSIADYTCFTALKFACCMQVGHTTGAVDLVVKTRAPKCKEPIISGALEFKAHVPENPPKFFNQVRCWCTA